MKYWKTFYIAAFAVVVLAILIKYRLSVQTLVIRQDNPEPVLATDWKGYVMSSLNDEGILLQLDGSTFRLLPGEYYFEDQNKLMLSKECFPKYFQCSLQVYPDRTVRIDKGIASLIASVDGSEAIYNEKNISLDAMIAEKDDEIYIPAVYLANYFQYHYEWNFVDATATMQNIKSDEKIYPYSYDFREYGRIGLAKNQADLGTCWAFASLSALESSLLPTENCSFSVDHMSYHNGYNISQKDGGEYTMSMAYLTSWKGPVYEADDPYGDGYSPEGLQPVFHVQEIQMIDGKNLDEIKKAVFLHGGVQSSLYMSVQDADGQNSEYYNNEKSSYCYIGIQKPNHDIVIVGWDDAYDAENFTTRPEGNGAFICMNSWGENFGDNGFFYVSYFDSNIGMHNIVYTRVDDVDNYDHIYQSDLCGWVGRLGYNRDRAYFANVYDLQKPQKIRAVGFYATGANTEYEVYLVRNFEDSSSLNERQLVAKGKFQNAGYYTVELGNGLGVSEGRCAVMVSINTPNSLRPIAVEYASNDGTSMVDLSDGEGYISLHGKQWTHVESTQNCNICLKMYTDDMPEGKEQ